MRARALGPAAVVGLALAGSGCGAAHAPPPTSVRSASTTTASSNTTTTTAAAPAASATTTAPTQTTTTAGGWRTPTEAVRAFTLVYVNWTAVTIGSRLRALATVSVGQARATLLMQAREIAGDRELHRGGVENSGTVEAVARVTGATRRYAVVTRERTGALHDAAYDGLAPEWHVSLATVTQTRAGLWVLSGWQPES